MASFGDSTISVSPEKIRQTAHRAGEICERMIARMESIEHSVAVSRAVWDSDSADLLRGYFEEDKKDYAYLKGSLKKKVEMLAEIAALYNQAEDDAGELSADLPDSIFL